MASNSFGNIFRITTWGESHGPAVGVVIDGCPSNISINEDEINRELARRAPGVSGLVSPRKEPDKVEILSGVFEGKTTGAPISLLIRNIDSKPSAYEPMKDLFRPGHAGFSYLKKYGIFDYQGGGRASARETACRVAAGAIASKVLSQFDIQIGAYLAALGSHTCLFEGSVEQLRKAQTKSAIFCPDISVEAQMTETITKLISDGDSIGGQVVCLVDNVPIGLGDPIYEKLEARLAFAMLSLPASKAFEIGEGVRACAMRGSEHNDLYEATEGVTKPSSNHAGGVLAGISTGEQLNFKVTLKPASSIRKTQKTTTLKGAPVEFSLPEGSRHDPCVAIRAVPVVEAMTALVLVDALMNSRQLIPSCGSVARTH